MSREARSTEEVNYDSDENETLECKFVVYGNSLTQFFYSVCSET